MRIRETFNQYCIETGQAAMHAAVKFKELRSDPDFFEKVFQVIVAGIQLAILSDPNRAASLARLSFVLNTAQMHDFYQFLKKPRDWFFPITADRIDENSVLESLTNILVDQVSDDPNDLPKLRVIAEKCLEKQFQSMREDNDAYRNVDEFTKVLKRRIRATVHPDFDLSQVVLKNNLEVTLRHVPFLERLTNWNWTAVDIGCVGLYFQAWGWDTAKHTEKLGQYPIFHWVKNHDLGKWVVALVCTGFLLKLLEAYRKLTDDALTEEDRRNKKWDAITSIFEFVYYGAMFTSICKQSNIQWLAILAKSLGLISIAVKPKHEYFQPLVSPAA